MRCKATGCDREQKAKWLCAAHYAQAYRGSRLKPIDAWLWTKGETEALRELYADRMPVAGIALELGTTCYAVWRKAKRLGLSRRRPMNRCACGSRRPCRCSVAGVRWREAA